MMTSVVANSSSNYSQLSSFPTQEKGSRNKRKFRADPPLSDPSKVLPSSGNDGLSYEFSAEKFEVTTSHGQSPSLCDCCGVYQDHSDTLKLDLGLSCSTMAGPSEFGPSHPREEAEANEFQDADWSDLSESQLEELVLSNLDAIFRSAIKKIVACGYTEDIATKAVLRSGLCYGSKDTVSNVVDNALAFLRNGLDVDASRDHCFGDLQQLEKYVLAELVCVLREVRPFFSTGDAMWCLLICDMNVSHACAMDSDLLSNMITDESSNVSPSCASLPHFKADPKAADMSYSKPYKAIPSTSASVSQSEMNSVAGVPNFTQPRNSRVMKGVSSEKDGSTSLSSSHVDKPFSSVGIPHTPANEDKFVSSRRIHSNSSKCILRQKSVHLEKSHRTHGTKGSSRSAKFSGFVLDKKFKAMSDSAGLNLKSASLKLSKAMAMGMELAHETGSVSCTANSAVFPTLNIETSMAASFPETGHSPVSSTSSSIKTESLTPSADTELSLSLPAKSNPQQVNASHDVGLSNTVFPGTPYNKSMSQWAPQDKKDDIIVKLVPRIRELQNQLQEWTEWANEKVMQAARRLGKDKGELKTLRQEKEEVERLKKEKQTLEESTIKKLSEMENALCKASGQVERANAAVKRLEVENTMLRREMEAAKLHAADSAASCQEVSKREKKTLIKLHSWERKKSMFQEELAAERRKLAQLQQEIEQAKDLQNQLEARWKLEEKAKEELVTEANLIRKERDQLEASAKHKEDTIKSKAEENLLKYKEGIQKLEKEISRLRLKTDSSKIAALKRGIDGSYASRLADSQSQSSKECRDSSFSRVAIGNEEFSGSGGVKRERECVMCLSEEMSVVFLPCAHQVVCKMCNELHEKQGMNDCPSCRSPIHQRICVRYAPS